MNFSIFNVLSVVEILFFLLQELPDIFIHFYRLSTLFCLDIANIPRKSRKKVNRQGWAK